MTPSIYFTKKHSPHKTFVESQTIYEKEGITLLRDRRWFLIYPSKRKKQSP